MSEKERAYGVQKDRSAAKMRVDRVLAQMLDLPPSDTDPNGSYTGRPRIEGETPVQDADDL